MVQPRITSTFNSGIPLKNEKSITHTGLLSSVFITRLFSISLMHLINYYSRLGINPKASRHKAFKSFKRKYLAETDSEQKIELLTGILLILNERQKFYDILLQQQANGQDLTTKYLNIIQQENTRSTEIVNSKVKEPRLQKALIAFPFEEASKGLPRAFFGLLFSDKYFFSLFFQLALMVIVFTVLAFRGDIQFLFISIPLLLLDFYILRRIIRRVRMDHVLLIASYPIE